MRIQAVGSSIESSRLTKKKRQAIQCAKKRMLTKSLPRRSKVWRVSDSKLLSNYWSELRFLYQIRGKDKPWQAFGVRGAFEGVGKCGEIATFLGRRDIWLFRWHCRISGYRPILNSNINFFFLKKREYYTIWMQAQLGPKQLSMIQEYGNVETKSIANQDFKYSIIISLRSIISTASR